MDHFEHKLNHGLLLEQEDSKYIPYDQELAFYELVKNGDVEAVKNIIGATPFGESKGFGTLSSDPVRNIRYHFVILASMITRFCSEGGMNYETACNLCEAYIQKVDSCITVNEIERNLIDMILTFTNRMVGKKCNNFSKRVVLAIEYICENIHKKITLEQLARVVNAEASYFSKLFKKETGLTVSLYIRKRKIEYAQGLLKYGGYKYSEIAEYLAFSSQSHFTDVFRKETGYTPMEYRNQFYRRKWLK